MLCWKCNKEMNLEYTTPWHKNKHGDKIRTGTYVCWHCETVTKIETVEMNLGDGE